MNKSITIETDNKRLRPKDSEVERLWADNKKAADLLHWQPKYGGLDGFKAGLSKTIEWFSNLENLSNYKSDIYNV
jgi:dTDP-glucose 4,6-dehydratase